MILILFLLNKDQLAQQGRAKIEQAKQEQLATIETKRQTALAQLTVQYAAADKAKSTFGYIGIISLSVLFGSIFMNDYLKLLAYIFEQSVEYFEERAKEEEKKRQLDAKIKEEQNEEIVININEKYSEDLGEKLDSFYMALIKAKAKRLNKY